MKHLYEVEGPMLALAAAFGDPACCFAQGAVIRWEHAAFL